MSGVVYTLYVRPFGKQRPQWNRHSGRPFTPEKTREFEKQVADASREYFIAPFIGPVRLRISFVFEPPKSWSQQKYQERINTPHTQRPDADNLYKAVADALNGVAYTDDEQVAHAEVWKVWGPQDKIVISVEEI